MEERMRNGDLGVHNLAIFDLDPGKRRGAMRGREYAVIVHYPDKSVRRTVTWKELSRLAGKARLSCWVEDADGRIISASSWSHRKLNEWLSEVNESFGRRNIRGIALDPDAGHISIELEGWKENWGYYLSSPPWYAAQAAALYGGEEFRRWRGW